MKKVSGGAVLLWLAALPALAQIIATESETNREREERDVRVPECLQSAIWFTHFAPSEAGTSAGGIRLGRSGHTESQPNAGDSGLTGRTETETPTDLRPLEGTPLVAILDGAVDLYHPAYRFRLEAGRDFIDGDGNPGIPVDAMADPDLLRSMPGYLHATAVTGLVAAGGANYRIAVYRVLDENCMGNLYRVAAGIMQAVDDGASVLVLPLGSQLGSRELRESLKYAELNDVLVVASAGNIAGPRTTVIGKTRNVMAVAAVDSSGLGADFTAYGAHVDIADRGVLLPLLAPAGASAFGSGTSLAAARTAAAAASLRAAMPHLSALDIADILEWSASPLNPDEYRRLGAGITNLPAALQLAHELYAGELAAEQP